jgi:hypothetical protein
MSKEAMRMAFSVKRSVEVLQRTPGNLRALLGEGLDEFWTRSNYGPDTFSPFDVVGHLIHADETNWLPRLRLIFDRGEAEAFAPFDRYAMYKASQGKSMSDLLDAFTAIRARSLDELRALNLTPEQLGRKGTHPQLGGVTAANLIAAWVVHDLNHVHQVAKCMAFQYRDAVGPWRELLTILPKA